MRRICSWHECRNPFETAREDARFCSNNCRAKANKAKHRAAEASPGASSAARPERTPSNAPEPPAAATKKYARDDFSFGADQGDYHPDQPDVIPGTPIGRIARLEDRLHDLEQDFDLAEPDRKAWDKLRPKLELLIQKGPVAAPIAAAAPGLSADQVTNIVRTEVTGILKSWRERILQHDSQIAELRGELEQLSGRVKAVRKVEAALAPPPAATAAGTDKRVVAKITELEAAVEGVRERLDAVESDVAEAWQAIWRQASGADEEEGEDEDDDAA